MVETATGRAIRVGSRPAHGYEPFTPGTTGAAIGSALDEDGLSD
jgi:hypothetical protein